MKQQLIDKYFPKDIATAAKEAITDPEETVIDSKDDSQQLDRE